jgi:hypothetical protein
VILERGPLIDINGIFSRRFAIGLGPERQNKLQTAIASVTPAGVLAEQHRRMAEPGSGTNVKS